MKTPTIAAMEMPPAIPATTPAAANPISSRRSLHDAGDTGRIGLPPSISRSTTAAATAATIVPPRRSRLAVPITSSMAKTTPVVGVLKIAAMPAAVPTGIMLRTMLFGARAIRAIHMAAPLAITTVGLSGPSGAPAPSKPA